MGKLLLGLGIAAGGAAAAVALSDGRLDRARGWLRERGGELNENPLEETRGNLEQFSATAQARTGDALDRASRMLDDGAAVDDPFTAQR